MEAHGDIQAKTVGHALSRKQGVSRMGADACGLGTGPFQAKFGAHVFVVLESWESPEALGAHVAAPHMAAYGKQTKDLIASRAIHVLSAID
jgi:hypothetical protein